MISSDQSECYRGIFFSVDSFSNGDLVFVFCFPFVGHNRRRFYLPVMRIGSISGLRYWDFHAYLTRDIKMPVPLGCEVWDLDYFPADACQIDNVVAVNFAKTWPLC